MLPNATETRSFGVEIQCRYLLHGPAEIGPSPVLVLALHGYASNPQDMLRLTLASLGDDCIVASLQGPNQHYSEKALPGTHPSAAYNWGVRYHWEDSVRTHHEIVSKVLAALRHRFDLTT